MAEARVVLITGAGGALGGAVAEAFRGDSRLALTDRRMDRLESVYGKWPDTLLATCELDDHLPNARFSMSSAVST